MTPFQPHQFTACYQWIIENNFTPYFTVCPSVVGVHVPPQYANSPVLVLNVSPTAASNLKVDKSGVSFSAKFQGRSTVIFIPWRAAVSLQAKENSAGVAFSNISQEVPAQDPVPAGKPKAALTLVVDNKGELLQSNKPKPELTIV